MLYRDDTLSSRKITYVLSPSPEVAVVLPAPSFTMIIYIEEI